MAWRDMTEREKQSFIADMVGLVVFVIGFVVLLAVVKFLV